MADFFVQKKKQLDDFQAAGGWASLGSEQKQLAITLGIVVVIALGLSIWRYGVSINYFTYEVLRNDAKANLEALERSKNSQNQTLLSLGSLNDLSNPTAPNSTADDYVSSNNANPITPPNPNSNNSAISEFLIPNTDTLASVEVTEEKVAEAENYLRSIGIENSMIAKFSEEEKILYAEESKLALSKKINNPQLKPEQLAALLNLVSSGRAPEDFTTDEIKKVLIVFGINTEQINAFSEAKLRQTFIDVYNSTIKANK